MCDETAQVVTDCAFWEYLDPEWSVKRILVKYPYFDHEEAASKIWHNAIMRALPERSGDPDMWSPSRLPDLLAERNEVEVEAARKIYVPAWLKYATAPGYRDQLGWRREVFARLHLRVLANCGAVIPNCEELKGILEDGTGCEVYRYLSAEWTIERGGKRVVIAHLTAAMPALRGDPGTHILADDG